MQVTQNYQCLTKLAKNRTSFKPTVAWMEYDNVSRKHTKFQRAIIISFCPPTLLKTLVVWEERIKVLHEKIVKLLIGNLHTSTYNIN